VANSQAQSQTVAALNKYSPANCSPMNFSHEHYVTLQSAEPLSQEEGAFWVSLATKGKHPVSDFLKIELGQEVNIARCLPPGRWVIVGKGIISQANGNLLEGKIKEASSSLVSSHPTYFFQRPMTGDYVFPIHTTITKKINIYPKMTFANEEIFEQNMDGTYSAELSQRGAEEIEKAVRKFAQARGKILIEGFINKLGDQEERRLESLIRAQAVVSHIRLTFDLSSEQTMAIGLGSEGMELGMRDMNLPQNNITEGITIRLLPE
jgi:hypothetical protein